MLANVVELERSAAGGPIVGAMRIGVEHLTALSRGCAVLGTGGGGEVDTSTLIARQALDDHGPVNLVTLDDLPDDGLIMPVGMIGAPSVSIEKLSSGNEINILRTAVEEITGQPVVAMACCPSPGPQRPGYRYLTQTAWVAPFRRWTWCR